MGFQMAPDGKLGRRVICLAVGMTDDGETAEVWVGNGQRLWGLLVGGTRSLHQAVPPTALKLPTTPSAWLQSEHLFSLDS